MRLTTRTNLAARVLMFCAVNEGRIVRTAEIADRCNASLNHLLQVVHLLQEHGFVTTLRGRTGGLRLAQPMAHISVGQVFRVFEGGVPFAECFDPATNTCPLSGTCRLRGYLTRAVEAFFHELDMVTLADLVKGNCGLAGLLDMAQALRPDCKATAD
ncbi:MAG: Rrf2 family transcriptional regulator [Gemmobacter sp.]|nr:Rrf2 family transcriptional regulator [Gemmobacter sp.]